jgi:hypothetical protein
MAKKLARKSTSRPGFKAGRASKKPVVSKSRTFVYFFGNGKAVGDRTMKDLLGG